MLLGGPEVLGRVYRPQYRILHHALVEPVDQAAEGLFPAYGLVEAGRLAHAQSLRSPGPGILPVPRQSLVSEVLVAEVLVARRRPVDFRSGLIRSRCLRRPVQRGSFGTSAF